MMKPQETQAVEGATVCSSAIKSMRHALQEIRQHGDDASRNYTEALSLGYWSAAQHYKRLSMTYSISAGIVERALVDSEI